MVDENRLEIQDAQSRDVAIFAGNLREIFQRIVVERSERPSFKPLGGAVGKFPAGRAPHALMLCRRSHGVNAARLEALKLRARGAPGFESRRAGNRRSRLRIPRPSISRTPTAAPPAQRCS